MNFPSREFDEVVGAICEGTFTEAQAGEMNSLLRRDPEALEEYLWRVELHQRLTERGEHPLPESVPNVQTTTTGRRFAATPRNLSLATVVTAVVTLLAVVYYTLPRPAPELGEITQVMNPAPPIEGAGHAVGQRLQAGRLMLSRGAIEITLSNGVTLLFEGPGELELLTPMRALLHSGQVVVRVPENAIGFQMDAPSARVVDLGTEFAMKAGPGLETDVQVFEGLVEASPSRGGFASRLVAGHAARFTPTTSVPTELPYSDSRFLRKLPVEPGVPMPATRGKAKFREARHTEAVIPSLDKGIRVDGDLSDWSGEGNFFSQLDPSRSVEGRMRYDAGAFYLAAHIRDPSPMRNQIDPGMDGEVGWRGGGLQVRLSLDRSLGWPVDANSPSYFKMRKLPADAEQISRAANERLVTLTLWHHEPSATDNLHLAFGMDYSNGEVNPSGYSSVFNLDPDGAGYTVEARVPWSLLRVEDNPPRAGDALAVCWHTHWSDSSGRVWRDSLIELRNPNEPLRIYDFERAATWGRALYR